MACSELGDVDPKGDEGLEVRGAALGSVGKDAKMQGRNVDMGCWQDEEIDSVE